MRSHMYVAVVSTGYRLYSVWNLVSLTRSGQRVSLGEQTDITHTLHMYGHTTLAQRRTCLVSGWSSLDAAAEDTIEVSLDALCGIGLLSGSVPTLASGRSRRFHLSRGRETPLRAFVLSACAANHVSIRLGACFVVQLQR